MDSQIQEQKERRYSVPIALTIAGSDPSGGAGMQADRKTCPQHRIYGASVITLITAQNTQGVFRVEVLSPDLISAQLQAVLDDLQISAIKTGALGNRHSIAAIARILREKWKGPLVIDPVFVRKHGHPLIEEDAIGLSIETLFPLATLLTPNRFEIEQILKKIGRPRPINDLKAMEEEGAMLSQRFGCAVLVKGGHMEGAADDVLCIQDRAIHFKAPRIETKHTHGTGCSYASAIASHLAWGQPLEESIRRAKAWIHKAISRPPEVGMGIGPIDHFAAIDEHLELSRGLP
ncbi:MAG: bifunctional hydroxymethylpyrimidine kinase/phosphomethylpyrimidine kinase [Deltaproteobacteria bacterium]|nr:bifunctional hydroxymethylpyrimidine kinase/phosphomethylpyrimidine kinase [Deltaproteobacteria bacterium]